VVILMDKEKARGTIPADEASSQRHGFYSVRTQ